MISLQSRYVTEQKASNRFQVVMETPTVPEISVHSVTSSPTECNRSNSKVSDDSGVTSDSFSPSCLSGDSFKGFRPLSQSWLSSGSQSPQSCSSNQKECDTSREVPDRRGKKRSLFTIDAILSKETPSSKQKNEPKFSIKRLSELPSGRPSKICRTAASSSESRTSLKDYVTASTTSSASHLYPGYGVPTPPSVTPFIFNNVADPTQLSQSVAIKAYLDSHYQRMIATKCSSSPQMSQASRYHAFPTPPLTPNMAWPYKTPSPLAASPDVQPIAFQQISTTTQERPPVDGRRSLCGSPKADKSKRIRTIFTSEQLERLEQEFEKQHYMVGTERYFLARQLNLSEAQVKVWFQNRRIKWRKQKHSSTPSPTSASPLHKANFKLLCDQAQSTNYR